MRVMNIAYALSGFSFNTKSIDYHVNDTWATAGTAPLVLEYKTALRKGSYEDLNLYFLSDIPGGNLGSCTYPQQNITDLARRRDGCSNLAGTLPGAETTDFDLGKTAVHETGHWLGLFHTFDGNNCTGEGDFVADTPAQWTPTDGRPVTNRTNSRPMQEGLDPIHNYMDYSSDVCMTEFTKMQSVRMLKTFAEMRKGRK
ncbi:unnamed protein product [Zymoseptoria tritici ST99CH_1E4]|uniref:Peptidase M43 pregnancy-associated plasma-A domain-containing protein n=1 Tax=Zymoseptoria tritici ST99CH_1E4 TaxID=1276532 RepID=A0A2H1GXV6_ZYMTR|nr:unnamed protein product [Zymoseptoria tritici ST99CH_1E4]